MRFHANLKRTTKPSHTARGNPAYEKSPVARNAYLSAGEKRINGSAAAAPPPRLRSAMHTTACDIKNQAMSFSNNTAPHASNRLE